VAQNLISIMFLKLLLWRRLERCRHGFDGLFWRSSFISMEPIRSVNMKQTFNVRSANDRALQ